MNIQDSYDIAPSFGLERTIIVLGGRIIARISLAERLSQVSQALYPPNHAIVGDEHKIMAFKRRDVSLAGIASFFAWVYAVNYAPTLRWVSYAFIIGLLLPVFGIIVLIFLTSRGSQRGETISIRRPRRPAFLAPAQWEKDVTALRAREYYQKNPLYPESFTVSNAFDELLELVLKDFINSWYSNISNNPIFAHEVDRIIRQGLASLRDRLFELDLTTVLTTRFVPILTVHFREYIKAERAIRGEYLNRTITESEELDLAIAAKYNSGRLHPAASSAYSDTKLVQQGYLRSVTKQLLPRLLSKSVLSSPVASVLINELVSCAVLFPVMQLLAEPDTWNQIMELYGRSMLQDRSTVRKLRFALDQHASPISRLPRTINFPRLAPGDHERKFEKFIRAIRRANNLSDARRFRSEVSSQLKKDSLQEGQDQVYLRRLDIGKRILDQRVNQLAASGEKSHVIPRNLSNNNVSRLENASLVDLLRDPSGLTYFMEYMDRLNLMPLVQFWIVVDGLRTPLEDDLADDDIPTNPPWTNADRTDLAQINDVYLSKLELKTSDSSRQALHDFLKAGKDATPMQYYLARRSILRAQTAALEVMQEEHFQNFKKSDLFYKCLTSQEAMKSQMQGSVPPSLYVTSQKRQTPVRASSWQTIPKPSPVPKVSAKPISKRGDFRRQVASSLDLTASGNDLESVISADRSLDLGIRPSLDEDNIEVEGISNTMHDFDQELENNMPDTKVVQAMEAALNTILGDRSDIEDLRKSLFGDEGSIRSLDYSQGILSSRNSIDQKRTDLFRERPEKSEKFQKPNISSLGLVNISSRIGVFTDDDLFPDEDKFISDEHDDPEEIHQEQDEEVHEAAPGDLGLAEAITALTIGIQRLSAQDAVVDSMTRKAELTNNTAELRILKKSKASLQREIRHKELQRRQYIIQEGDNSLYGRSTIKIKSTMVGKEEDGKEFAIYMIEVQRKAGEQMPAATWTITRRYSEFLDVHQKLREKYASIRNLDFPRRRMVMKLQPEFLHKRRLALERYLREVLLMPEVCRSRELRTFLSESSAARGGGSPYGNDENKKDLITRLYNSFTDGIEDIFGGIPVFDQLSVTGQNLISAATQQLLNMPAATNENSLDAAEAEAELNAFEDREFEPFVKPICDIFLEIFELNRSNNWLRGRAVVVVLHQLLGSTIERKVREIVKGLFSEDAVIKYTTLVRDSIWHDGELKKDSKPRTPAEKSKSKTEASLMLATLVPDLASSVVGRVNAQAAGRRIFATFNNPRLNVHLVFTLLDEIIDILFSDKRS